MFCCVVLYRGGGGISLGDNFAGKMSPCRLVTKLSPQYFFGRNLGHFLLFVCFISQSQANIPFKPPPPPPALDPFPNLRSLSSW